MTDPDDLDSDDGFGPATDLVLSLLGVIVLLLAISQYQQRLSYLINADKTVSAVEAKPTAPSDDPAKRIRDLTNLLAQRDAELADARKNLLAVPLRVVALKLDGRSVSFFERNSAELHPAMQQLIAGYKPTLARLVLANHTNEIEVTGFASPEPSGGASGKDSNLDVSVERSVAVAHYLATLGIPYQCLSVSGFGRGRSEILYGAYVGRDPQNSVATWDSLMSTEKGRELRNRLEEELSQERRVEIALVADRNSSCTTEQLQKALGL